MALLLGYAGAGAIVLAVASTHFVRGSAGLAKALNISPVVIGAVVIGFGTSSPEIVASVVAALEGSRDIAVGNIVGSNLANLTLILGLLAVVAQPALTRPTLRRELPLATGAVMLLAVLLQAGLSAIEAGLLLVALAATMWWMIRRGFAEGERDELGVEDELPARPRMAGSAVRALVGLAGTLGGAQLLVHGARGLATEFGLAEGFVGLTLVAVGTSLPEGVTALQAARQGRSDLAIGNILGSNIFNSFAIGGLIGLITPGRVGGSIAGVASLAMASAAVVVAAAMRSGRAVSRSEGGVLLAGYAVVVFLSA